MATTLATISEWHIILVLIIVFLLFGGKKLPELARGIGQAMKEFKKAQREVNADEAARTATTPPAAAQPDGTKTANAPAAQPQSTEAKPASAPPKPDQPKSN